MRREEISGFGDLLGDAAGGLATQIHEMHDGIARRVWKAVGPASIPVRFAHDRLADSAYSAATEFTRSLVRRGAHAISASQPEEAESIERSPFGRAAVRAPHRTTGGKPPAPGKPAPPPRPPPPPHAPAPAPP